MRLKQLFLLAVIYCIGFLFLLPKQHPTFAQIVFTDDFSTEYEKWQDIRNTFHMWSIVNEQADVFISQGSTLAELIPKNEYWNDEWKNYVYKLDYTFLEGADKALSFWFKDILNWYQFHFVGNMYILSHVKNGIEVWRESGSLVLDAGRKYRMEVHLEDGKITFFKDGIKEFEYTDPTFENDYGRIGLKSGAGSVVPTHVQFDNIEVSLIEKSTEEILKIETIKQTDPLWKDTEYDSAVKWAQDNRYGIGDWGCLITSINMILKYHNITNFIDGTEITPKTLNNWLIQQPDGYIGTGLVNWSAITRLVKQIHDTTGTVNLEYSRISHTAHSENKLQTAITEIENKKPVILEIPGHFLVGNGVAPNKDDLHITDPAYTYSILSNHNSNLLSTRLLTPSNTDLSYIHMGHTASVSVSLLDNSGSVPKQYQSYPQTLMSFPEKQETTEYILHELAKPESGIYTITITSDSETVQPFELAVFAYDIDANVSNLTFSGLAGTVHNPTVVTILFDKNGPSILSQKSTYETLLNQITNLLQTNEIKKHYVALELERLALAAMHANTQDKIRYIFALKHTIAWYSEYISKSGQESLINTLIKIQENM